jgi:WxL domain surface cell wall-binding
MRTLLHPLAARIALAVGLVAGSAALTSAAASAAACGGPVPAGSNCTMTGTVDVAGGALTLTSPASLSWSATLTGTDQSAVDVVPGDQQYTVDDATGTGAGWHVTTSATTFTSGSDTLPDAGTFVTNGSVSSVSAASGPTATCTGTCTLPTDTTTYPVAITTAASSPTAVTIYDASAGTGLGQVVIGGSAAANPVGWWVNLPADTVAGTYTSTITMAIVSAP